MALATAEGHSPAGFLRRTEVQNELLHDESVAFATDTIYPERGPRCGRGGGHSECRRPTRLGRSGGGLRVGPTRRGGLIWTWRERPRPEPSDIRTYPRLAVRFPSHDQDADLQGFYDRRCPSSASLKIVVSPVRFRPSPLSEPLQTGRFLAAPAADFLAPTRRRAKGWSQLGPNRSLVAGSSARQLRSPAGASSSESSERRPCEHAQTLPRVIDFDTPGGRPGLGRKAGGWRSKSEGGESAWRPSSAPEFGMRGEEDAQALSDAY